MRNKFYKVKLKDILSVKRGTSLSGQYYATSGDKIRLTLGNFNYPNGGFKTNTSKDNIYFSAPVKSEYILKKGDIITPLTEQVAGLLGETAKIPEDDLYIQSGDIALIIPKEDKLYKDFAYYLISSKMIKYQLGAAAQQTKIRHTSPEKIENCEAWIPQDIETQRDISHLLDTINDKIALNNKINQELEQMAKTLYEYWFVQFDFPDEKGRPYKSANGKMVYNDILKREIPEGWEVKPLKRLIKHINTGLNPRDNFTLGNGNIKYITVKNITENNLLDFKNCDVIDEVARDKVHNRSDIKVGDILFASITPLGRCYLIEDEPSDWDINESVFSIRPDRTQISSDYLLMCLTSEYFVKRASNSSTGSIFTGIRIKTLEDMPILLPPKHILEIFTTCLQSLLNKKNLCFKENINLEELRDFLLPLLMNGQVIVSSER